jgi:hypothetical protein
MTGAIYTHYALHDKFDRMAPGIIFNLLLITRLVIYWQGKRSDLNIKKEKSNEVKKKIDNEEDNTQESDGEESEDQTVEDQTKSNEKKKA